MNEQLTVFIENIIKKVIAGRSEYRRSEVKQIGNYFHNIALIQAVFGKEIVTIAYWKHGNHAHLMMFDKSNKEIKDDYEGKQCKKKLMPKVIFNLKVENNRVVAFKIEPAKSHQINVGDFGSAFMQCYLRLHQQIYAAKK